MRILKKGSSKMVEKNKLIIEAEMKKYYGDRYYDEYAYNPLTGDEFEKLRELIFTCIEKCK